MKITKRQKIILKQVSKRQGSKITYIGRETGIGSSGVITQLTILESRGLVRKVNKDGRSKLVYLTKYGLDLVENFL